MQGRPGVCGCGARLRELVPVDELDDVLAHVLLLAGHQVGQARQQCLLHTMLP